MSESVTHTRTFYTLVRTYRLRSGEELSSEYPMAFTCREEAESEATRLRGLTSTVSVTVVAHKTIVEE